MVKFRVGDTISHRIVKQQLNVLVTENNVDFFNDFPDMYVLLSREKVEETPEEQLEVDFDWLKNHIDTMEDVADLDSTYQNTVNFFKNLKASEEFAILAHKKLQ